METVVKRVDAENVARFYAWHKSKPTSSGTILNEPTAALAVMPAAARTTVPPQPGPSEMSSELITGITFAVLGGLVILGLLIWAFCGRRKPPQTSSSEELDEPQARERANSIETPMSARMLRRPYSPPSYFPPEYNRSQENLLTAASRGSSRPTQPERAKSRPRTQENEPKSPRPVEGPSRDSPPPYEP